MLTDREKEYRDAAEFSERVAVKLTDVGCPRSGKTFVCFCEEKKKDWSCIECRLKAARLAVEEEMDADGK